ncbi:MAG: BamA/TamA family outer membrane protein [Roseibium sp.]|uniref:ShlB/FhaC/HecB family hemolysin secretion/activation protein n=1 Tax=Roseibium sp. TaxID=1936156 RepID=UPI002602B509|nr:ShlB/FhaC/HecB family hemolysin secretion/activation protein [Roseibium sp.]MCV0424646.1 BamA/TamA family outer membrane protein [Roseibium sp.]
MFEKTYSPGRCSRGGARAFAVWFTLLFAGVSAPGLAQVVEENPAPLIFGEQRTGLGPQAVSDGGKVLQNAALQRKLEAFVGKPLSQRLLNEIRAEIIRRYRSADKPFVSVVAPPQEVTGGTLTLQVIEFKAGNVTAEGNVWTPNDYILDHVRQRPGEEIDASSLVQDLNWLNLNPYRSLGAVFEPGTVPGATDIVLRSNERRPWTVYAGYANSGTAASGRNRVFAGGNVANLPFLDHQISYLSTFNPESLGYGDLVNVSHAPGYASHAFSYFAPIDIAGLVRTKLQLTAGYVESGSVLNSFFDEYSQSWAITSELAFPLDLPGARQFDVFAGFDVKRQFSDIEFADTVVSKSNDDVGQFRLGARGQYGFNFGALDTDGIFEAYAALSPANMLANSTNYAYFYGSVEQITRWKQGFGISVGLAGQATGDELPDLEKIAIGGSTTVRGYTTNEVSGNSGIYGSLELRSPVFRHDLGTDLAFGAEAYAFFDAGYVWDDSSDDRGLQSIGAGLELAVSEYLTATIEAGHALSGGPDTNQGETSIFGTVVLRY